MLNSIIAFCLSRRTIVIFGLCLFAGAGYVALQKLDIEAYPNPTPVILEITAQAPGLSAGEIERYYTIPIENGLYTVPGVQVVRSTSFYGLSFVRVLFKYGVDYDSAYAQTAVALQQNVSLPGGVAPNIQQNSGTGEILRYQVVGPPHFGLANLRTVEDWIVRRRLLQVHGVAAVNSWGGPTKEFQVDVDPRKLRSYGLTLPQVLTALGNSNINVGGREIHIGQQSINIRGIGLIDDGGDDDLAQGYKVGDIEHVVLAEHGGVPVLIKDVAKVSVGNVPRLGIAGRDGDDDIVFGIVVMNRTYQTDQVLPTVEATIDTMNRDGSLPKGVKVVPYYDRASLVDVTTHTVLHNLLFGCLLIFLIQWIFLGDLRSALIVGLNIPFALLFAIVILVVRGESANLLSLGAVDFGIIVDSAVVLVENIFRNFQRPEEVRRHLFQRLAEGAWGPDPSAANGYTPRSGSWSDRLKLILISTMQVNKAVLFSILIIVAAFVPLFTMQGVEGAIFGPMARTYAYALTGALIATFTVTPVLASLLLPAQIKEAETVIVRGLHRLYRPVLSYALKHRGAMVATGLVFLGLTGFCGSRLGSEFLPHLDEGNLWIRAELPMTTSLEDGEAASREMREIIGKYPEVVTVVSQHGRPDDGSDASPFSNVELFVPLKPYAQWPSGMTKAKLVQQVDADLESHLPGVNFNFSQYIQDNIEEGISGVKGANSIKIIGPNLDTLTKLAAEVRDQIAGVRGITDVGVFPVLGQPNLDITVDRAKAARYGLNTGDVNAVIQAALGGTVATTVFEGDRQFALAVRYAAAYRDTVEKIRGLEVSYQTSSGGTAYVPLSELASIQLDTGASWIYHENGERFIPVKFSVRGRDLGGAVQEAQQRIADHVTLPAGYRLVWAGEFGELQAAKKRLEVIVPVSLVLILGLLYSLFNSLRACLLTLVGIPFTAAGGVLALWATGVNFSISAAIGFISLFGVSVMVGILFVTYYQHAKRRHDSPVEAMSEAASRLMRPLLMMSMSAGIGLLPAAVSTGIGSEVQRPLATVVVGGMVLGSILLLLVVPALEVMLLGPEDHRGEQKR
ncbi:MAG TPA: efflux RND transporter permease subunit [Gammaproteobacteria bacterium]|nr:efflux RND transporter permease subunit [Gammaproteobacteria bacterium]